MHDRPQILQRIKESVTASDPRATLILYGSYARGDYNEESDIDLLILVDKEKVTRDDKIKITYPLYDIFFETGVIISEESFSKASFARIVLALKSLNSAVVMVVSPPPPSKM